LLDSAPGAHPAAVQQFSAAEHQTISGWLDVIERDPAALFDFVHRTNRSGSDGSSPTDQPRAPSPRLGRRAERLMEFFLRHGPTHRLVAANIPLRHVSPKGDCTTVGEIDFLLQDSSGRPWHWELAVKFFLCTATGRQASAADFIGPDRAETFDTKLRKMFERQLTTRRRRPGTTSTGRLPPAREAALLPPRQAGARTPGRIAHLRAADRHDQLGNCSPGSASGIVLATTDASRPRCRRATCVWRR
jgi:hypothetical protein